MQDRDSLVGKRFIEIQEKDVFYGEVLKKLSDEFYLILASNVAEEQASRRVYYPTQRVKSLNDMTGYKFYDVRIDYLYALRRAVKAKNFTLYYDIDYLIETGKERRIRYET